MQRTETKEAALFVEALERAGLDQATVPLYAWDEAARTLEATVEIPDLHDWATRGAVFEVAARLGEEQSATVLCFMRGRAQLGS